MYCKEQDELDMKLIQASRAVLAYALEYGPGQDYRRGRLDANERRAREAWQSTRQSTDADLSC